MDFQSWNPRRRLGRAGIDLLKDIVVDILVELGHCELKVSEILNLDTSRGGIKQAGRGRGGGLCQCPALRESEVVVINESFGIRINSFFEDMEEQ